MSHGRISTPSNNDKPIVIIGAGPSGAAAALGAAKKGYHVVLVTKYSAATRTQRIKLNSSIGSAQLKLLKKYRDKYNKEDEKFFNRLKRNNYTASIGSIERYLKRKLAGEKKIRVIDEQIAELKEVNFEEGNIVIKKTGENNTEKIQFQHLVDASGVSRIAHKLARKTPGDNYEKPCEIQPPHLAQGTAIFHLLDNKKHSRFDITRHFPRNTIEVVKFSKTELETLKKKYGWDKNYPPKVYIISNKDRTKFYVGGEIPDHFLAYDNEKDKPSLAWVESWSKYILSKKLNIKTEDLYLKGKPPTLSMQGEGANDSKKYENYQKYVKEFNNIVSDFSSKKQYAAHLKALNIERNRIISGDDSAPLKRNKLEMLQRDKRIIGIQYKQSLNRELAEKAANSKFRMSVTSFELVLKKTIRPLRCRNTDKGVMVAIGDALQSPNFHAAHGLNDGLLGAKTFVEALPTKGKSNTGHFKVGMMRNFIKKIHQEHLERMKKIKANYPKSMQDRSDALLKAQKTNKQELPIPLHAIITFKSKYADRDNIPFGITGIIHAMPDYIHTIIEKSKRKCITIEHLIATAQKLEAIKLLKIEIIRLKKENIESDHGTEPKLATCVALLNEFTTSLEKPDEILSTVWENAKDKVVIVDKLPTSEKRLESARLVSVREDHNTTFAYDHPGSRQGATVENILKWRRGLAGAILPTFFLKKINSREIFNIFEGVETPDQIVNFSNDNLHQQGIAKLTKNPSI